MYLLRMEVTFLQDTWTMWTYSAKIWKTLTPHWPIDHPVNVELDFDLPHGRVYHLSEVEFNTLKANIQSNLVNGAIQQLL